MTMNTHYILTLNIIQTVQGHKLEDEIDNLLVPF